MSKLVQKRAISLLILSTLILALIPSFVTPVQAAISRPEIWNKAGTVNITLAPTYLTKGTVLIVNGTGVTAGNEVEVYWDYVTADGLLNTTEGEPSGDYECWITVPETLNGTHYIWVKDTVENKAVKSLPLYVVPKLTVDPDTGLKGDVITLTGYGYDSKKEVFVSFGPKANITTTPSTVKTDAVGSFTCTFKVPIATYGVYVVNATTKSFRTGLTKNTTFTIGPTITLDHDEGPSGMILKITGRGFYGNDLKPAWITFNSTGAGKNATIPTIDGKNITVSSAGKFTGQVIVPTNATGDYTVWVRDPSRVPTLNASADFELTGTSVVKISPQYGSPGGQVTVTGFNFTQVDKTKVTLTINGTSVGTAKTDANGEFTKAVTLPSLNLGKKATVLAVDENNLTATTDVLIALITLQLSETSGPVGSAVTLSGTGFNNTAGGSYNATFGDLDLIPTTGLGGRTYFTKVFYVPQVDPGTYTITVLDRNADIEVTTEYTVTESAKLTLDPISAPNGYNVTITGENFAQAANKTIWFIYNSTWSQNITSKMAPRPKWPAPVNSTLDGNFTAYLWLNRTAGRDLVLGEYTINCTTNSNAAAEVQQYAEVTITVVEESYVIDIRKTSYAVGDTVTFTIKATFRKPGSYVQIRDPDDYVYYNSTFALADWFKQGDWWFVPIGKQVDDTGITPFLIPEDATPGTWSWKMVDNDGDTLANGTFIVSEKTEYEQLQEQIDTLATDVAGVKSDVAGVKDDLSAVKTDVAGVKSDVAGVKDDLSAVKTDVAGVKTAADAAKAAADSAASKIDSVASTANSAKAAADAAKAAADSAASTASNAVTAAEAAKASAEAAKTAAGDAKSAASGLTTLVYGAIGASLIAALAAIVSLLQISRRIAG